MIYHQGHFWTETHCLFVKGCLMSSTLASARELRQKKAVLLCTSHARTCIEYNSEEILG